MQAYLFWLEPVTVVMTTMPFTNHTAAAKFDKQMSH
jgi:hypothetical protein